MATFIVKEKNSYDDFHRVWHKKYVIYKKRWYGLSMQAQTDDKNELFQMVSNLIKRGYCVDKHWTLTEDFI